MDQTQSSLGPFRQAPPPLAVSEAIQRPGSRWAEKTGLQSLGLCVDVSVARRVGGRQGRRGGGRWELKPHLSFQQRAPAEQQWLTGAGAQVPTGEATDCFLRENAEALSPPGAALAGCWRAPSARSGLWGQAWVSLMYGQSPSRAVLFLLAVQLTGKSSRASLSISSTAYPNKVSALSQKSQESFSGAWATVTFRFSADFNEPDVGGCLGELLLEKQVSVCSGCQWLGHRAGFLISGYTPFFGGCSPPLTTGRTRLLDFCVWVLSETLGNWRWLRRETHCGLLTAPACTY